MWIYENTSDEEQYLHTKTSYVYDEYGNCTQLTYDFGNTQSIRSEVRYDNTRIDKYIVGLPTEICILIVTGQLIGEGFDYPRLDTLIMATPVAWRGLVEQYAGRLNRYFESKQNVMIFDYIDAHIPVFDNMYVKRLKAYKRIGYKLYNEN